MKQKEAAPAPEATGNEGQSKSGQAHHHHSNHHQVALLAKRHKRAPETVTVQCPFCGGTHRHGAPTTDIEWRVSHCADGRFLGLEYPITVKAECAGEVV